MSTYKITCVTKSAPTWAGHQHIVSVGIAGEQYSVATIYSLMDQGHRFYTVSPSTGRIALVRKYHCCGLNTLRSDPDAVYDNNLDNLPICR